jgi:hypothetical protein
MRSIARTLGDHLRSFRGYRGAFGLDGVLTAGGFRVTDFNPRVSGGFSTLNAAIPSLSFRLLDVALREHFPLPSPDGFEDEALRAVDCHRVARGYTAWAGGRFTSVNEYAAVRDGRRWRLAAQDERPLAVITTTPSPGGGFLGGSLEDGGYTRGALLAPTFAALFDLADRCLGTSIGPLTAATPA